MYTWISSPTKPPLLIDDLYEYFLPPSLIVDLYEYFLKTMTNIIYAYIVQRLMRPLVE